VEFQLGKETLTGDRSDIIGEINEIVKHNQLSWDGAAFFGDLTVVVKPGDNVIDTIINNYVVHTGQIILGKVAHSGDPETLKDLVVERCQEGAIRFTGSVSFGGFSYRSRDLNMGSARWSLIKEIISKVGIEGLWNNIMFKGQIDDVSKRLKEYIQSLPMAIDGYDVIVGNTKMRLSDLGEIYGSDFVETVANHLTNRFVNYLKEN